MINRNIPFTILILFLFSSCSNEEDLDLCKCSELFESIIQADNIQSEYEKFESEVKICDDIKIDFHEKSMDEKEIIYKEMMLSCPNFSETSLLTSSDLIQAVKTNQLLNETLEDVNASFDPPEMIHLDSIEDSSNADDDFNPEDML